MKHAILFLRLLARGLWDCLKVCAWGVLAVLAFLGAIAATDAFRRPDLPTIRPATAAERAFFATVKPRQAEGQRDNDERWNRVYAALAYLDVVCPEVSDWVRDRHERGLLWFEEADAGRYAAYNPALGILLVNLIALEGTDAEIACTLAHEFRHSRQPLLPSIQSAIAWLFGEDRRDLVEPEAYQFEDRIRRALRGEKP